MSRLTLKFVLASRAYVSLKCIGMWIFPDRHKTLISTVLERQDLTAPLVLIFDFIWKPCLSCSLRTKGLHQGLVRFSTLAEENGGDNSSNVAVKLG